MSVNGADFVNLPYHAFRHNPYNTILAVSGNTNPMAGEWAFTGTDQGSFNGSWGQSQVDLLLLAEPGDTIVLRFDFCVDYCNGVEGWYVDNVKVLGRAIAPRRGGGRLGD